MLSQNLAVQLGKVITFPLYNNDGKAASRMTLSLEQKKCLDDLKRKIDSGYYMLATTECLCNNTEKNKELVVTEKDRFGLALPSVMCLHCSLIRSSKILDTKSLEKFYTNDYRDLYVGSAPDMEFFFKGQISYGKKFLSLIQEKQLLDQIETVFEVGCGAGGILYPFFQLDKKVAGCDFDSSYLDYGRARGISLMQGDFLSLDISDESQDLIILSHVLEHFAAPITAFFKIAKKVKKGKFVLVEAPGLLNMGNAYKDPLLYFHPLSHVYNFDATYLEVFFKQMGFVIISRNEEAVFLLQKSIDLIICPRFIYDSSLAMRADYLKKRLTGFWVEEYIFQKTFLAKKIAKIREHIVNVLAFLCIKEPLKKFKCLFVK